MIEFFFAGFAVGRATF